MSKKVGERRQPCLTPMVVRRKGRLHWWLCYWAACGTARLENELSREKRQNGGLTTQKALLLPTIGRPLVWLSSGEDGSFPKGKNSEKKFGRHPRKFFWLLLPHHPCEFHSGLPMSFFFSFLLSAYLLPVLLSHVFSSSVVFVRCTFCPFFYPMPFSLQFSSFVVPFVRSAISCLFLFSSLPSSYLLLVLLFRVFFSSVLLVRCTLCPFFHPMSFLLQSSSFVVPFARSSIPCLFFFSCLRSLYLLPVLLSHVFSSSVLFVRRTFCPFCYPMSFHFSSLRSSKTLNTSAVTQDFLTALRLPRISLAVSVTAAMKVLIGVSTSMLSTSSVVGDANPPPIITWKATTSSRSLSTHLYLL